MNIQPAKKEVETISTESLGENINELKHTRHVRGNNVALLEMIADKITINLDMFGPLMKHWVRSNMQGSFIVSRNHHRMRMGNTK